MVGACELAALYLRAPEADQKIDDTLAQIASSPA